MSNSFPPPYDPSHDSSPSSSGFSSPSINIDPPLPWPDGEIAIVSFSTCTSDAAGPTAPAHPLIHDSTTPAFPSAHHLTSSSPSACSFSGRDSSSEFPSADLIDLTGLVDSKPRVAVHPAERMLFIKPPGKSGRPRGPSQRAGLFLICRVESDPFSQM